MCCARPPACLPVCLTSQPTPLPAHPSRARRAQRCRSCSAGWPACGASWASTRARSRRWSRRTSTASSPGWGGRGRVGGWWAGARCATCQRRFSRQAALLSSPSDSLRLAPPHAPQQDHHRWRVRAAAARRVGGRGGRARRLHHRGAGQPGAGAAAAGAALRRWGRGWVAAGWRALRVAARRSAVSCCGRHTRAPAPLGSPAWPPLPAAAAKQVQGEARRAFGPLLDRAAKADRLRLVLGAMRRYEALVGLPARARQHAEAGDYEQVRYEGRLVCRLRRLRRSEGRAACAVLAPSGVQAAARAHAGAPPSGPVP